MKRLASLALALGLVLTIVFAPGPNGSSATAQVATNGLDLELLHQQLPDFDSRSGVVQPTAAQLNIVQSLGASVRWNQFGTPQSLIKYGDYLATNLSGDPATAAREWIRANRTLFNLSNQAVTELEVNDVQLVDSTAHAILFRQRLGNLTAVQDGMIMVGINQGKIAYVSSSAAGGTLSSFGATLSPQQAWTQAATDVGLSVGAISNVRTENDWTVFDVAGLAYPQRARLRALPIPGSNWRTVYEVNVLNVGAETLAYTSYVNARNGTILFRQSRMQHLGESGAPNKAPQAYTFQGSYSGSQCGPKHTYTAPAGTTKIIVVASALNPANDIVLNLIREADDTIVASSDTATSPEGIAYIPSTFVPGAYSAQVCAYQAQDPLLVDNYVGEFIVDDTPVVGPGSVPYNPKWEFFPNSPKLNYSSDDTRVLGCWFKKIYTENGPEPVPGCDINLRNTASRAPWDYDVDTEQPTFTTKGNNASTAEAWLSPLTPAEQYRPTSPQREYIYPWTNQWYEEKCSQEVFASPERNDIDAAITNLFVQHNRMHDWSYRLGFRENTYNAQQNNFGNQPGQPGIVPGGGENDPETGNAQAGAVSGGAPSYLGRDNANQITLQDGIPPITNMYLWQPIAAAFYAPCVDGDYDMSVIGHEYTHLISNRMVGGPDANLTGLQAGAMGESWSDLTAVEYLNEYSFVPLNQPGSFSVGDYVTGNKESGIRNYSMVTSPLNYSDVGYDVTGPQVHADGEIWSATNYAIRQAFVNKYNAEHPANDATEQQHCANGEPVVHCPGNRRWIQIVFDAYLLMQPSVSMLDARDAYLAADMMRFDGANQTIMWREFARRGMGFRAFSAGSNDTEPIPSFESPRQTNHTITFNVRANGSNGAAIPNAKIYVGHYEARVTPIADTDGGTALGSSAKFVSGTYEFVVQAPGYGLRRFKSTISGNKTLTFAMPTNWASAANGATASGDGINQQFLIDDTEATNWAALDRQGGVNGAFVIVKMDKARSVAKVHVSAMLRAQDPNDAGGDTQPQNRFTALRKFEILTCNTSSGSSCAGPGDFTSVYISPDDAFPSVAPRPTAPTLIFRAFDVQDSNATHVMLRVLTNQCIGGPQFQGDQDNDPSNNSDCNSSPRADEVRAAELQVFSK